MVRTLRWEVQRRRRNIKEIAESCLEKFIV